MECSACGFINPQGMKFCGQCGAQLEGREYGERRNTTVMFVDLSGYTRLSETIDAEEVKEILDTIFSVVSESVQRYKGSVNKLIGDCAMCLFGFPTAVENHPEKALLSLRLIYETIEEIFRFSPHAIKLHTGVNTGMVIVEQIGIGKTSEYTIMGDTVNLASRLQCLAHPGEILVGFETWRRTKGLFNFDEIGAIDVKGKKEPVRTFRFTGLKEKRGKIRGIKGVEPPMIGRQEELAELSEAVRSYCHKRRDRTILITGEPGIGKTRLYEELKKGTKDVRFFEGRALPYEAEPFYPLIMILNRLIEQKGEEVFSHLFPDGKVGLLPIHPFIKLILTGEIPSGLKSTPPDKLKLQKFFILEVILRKISAVENTVFVFEDMHWADEETMEFIEYLMGSVKSDSGLFLILLARPPVKDERFLRFFRSVRDQETTKFLRLRPLNYDEFKSLIGKLLEIEQLPEEFKRGLIYDKSEGNPFFCEELVKILIENGVLVKVGDNWRVNGDVKVFPELPSTIEEVVLSLVDKLDPDEKRFLRSASIIGKTFFKEGVERILDLDDAGEVLTALIKLRFIRLTENSFLDFKEYEFAHGLLYEAIHRSLLKKHRKILHRKFAEWLEELVARFPGRVTLVSLSEHFESAEEYKKAFAYNEQAADRYRDNYANLEAIKRYEKALQQIGEIRDPSFAERLPGLHLSLGVVYSRLSEYKPALDSLDKAFSLAKKDRDKCLILLETGSTYEKMSDYSQAYYYYSLADSLAPDNSVEKLRVLKNKAWLYYQEGNLSEFKRALDACRSLFDTVDFADDKDRLKLLARVENFFGTYYGELGHLSKCLEHYTHSLGIYEQLDDLAGKSSVYNNIGTTLQKDGKLSEGLEAMVRSLEIDKNTGDYLGYAISLHNVGEHYIFLNRLDKAEEYYDQYFQISKKVKSLLMDGYALSGLGELHRMQKEKRKAREAYDRSIKIFDKLGSEGMKRTTEARLADFFIENGKMEEGFKILEANYPYARKNDIFDLLIDLNVGYAKYYLMKYREDQDKRLLDKGESHLKNIAGLLTEKGEDVFARLKMSKLDLRYKMEVGDEQSVEASRVNFQAILDRIVGGITDETDRKSFLSREEIRSLSGG
ncbi:MAG TPA: tetratricopeptide repeat protein [bacterium (Candidatus Stahlbacteria)]|nr:tetratricopeptide repeat protein [Candidatus Stahlbacteria bacterium]